jgi:hypothetical protein
LYSIYRQEQQFYLPPNTIGGGNAATANLTGPTGQRVKIYYCPSDRFGAVLTAAGDPYFRARGNYHLNWGPVQQPDPRRGTANPPSEWGPFGYRDFGSRNQPRYTRFSEISDGTSNTLQVSEMITPRDGDVDHRGDLLNDDEACTYFMTLMTPNTKSPDVMAVGSAQSTGMAAPLYDGRQPQQNGPQQASGRRECVDVRWFGAVRHQQHQCRDVASDRQHQRRRITSGLLDVPTFTGSHARQSVGDSGSIPTVWRPWLRRRKSLIFGPREL